VKTGQTAMGCMSGAADPECAGLIGQLGLAAGEPAPPAQKVFRVKAAASLAR
jgi:hypothetical protein